MEDFVPLLDDSDADEDQKPPGQGQGKKRKRVDVALKNSKIYAGHEPWMHSVSRAQSPVDQLTDEIIAFNAYILPTEKEHALRSQVIHDIRQAITSRYSDSQLEAFGSYKSGLYLPSGDIDLVVLSQAIAYMNPKTVLYSISALLRARGIAEATVVIWKARVPIVKFRSTKGNFAVDISLNQLSGIDAGPVVRQLLKSVNDTAARSLIMVIKAFLVQRGLHEVFSGGLSSYSRKEIDPMRNLGVLLVEFFELYGKHFNLDRTGIIVRHPGGYFDKLKKGWYRERQPYLLSIEDPQNVTNDISGGSHNILAVRQSFSGAFDMLSGELCSMNIYKQRNSRRSNMDQKSSILASIITLDPDMVKGRDLNTPNTKHKRYRDDEEETFVAQPPIQPTKKAKKNPPAPSPKNASKREKSKAKSSVVKDSPKKHSKPDTKATEYIILDSEEEADVTSLVKSDVEDGSRYAINSKTPSRTNSRQASQSKNNSRAPSEDSSIIEILDTQSYKAARKQENRAKPDIGVKREYWSAKGGV